MKINEPEVELKFNLDMKYQEMVLELVKSATQSGIVENLIVRHKAYKIASVRLWGRLSNDERIRFEQYKTDIKKDLKILYQKESVAGIRWDEKTIKYEVTSFSKTEERFGKVVPEDILKLRELIDDELDNWGKGISVAMVGMNLILLSETTFKDYLQRQEKRMSDTGG